MTRNLAGVAKPATATQGSMLTLAAQNKSPSDYDELQWLQVRPEVLNWDRLFPYQLLVVRRSENGFVRDERWTFTLPLPPGAIQIMSPTGMDGRPTLTGWVEQGGGTPFKQIAVSGTTGVLPLRGSAQARPTSLAQTIFGGALQQAQQVALAAQQVSQAISPTRDATNLVTEDEISGDIGKTSGYYQFRLLQQFLERYAAMKKTVDGKDRFLALAMWKDEAVYLCTPTGAFAVTRSAASPMEYEYSFQLKGFRRISLDRTPTPDSGEQPILRNPDKLSRALRTISQSREVLHTSLATMRAALGDLTDTVLSVLREASLFLKEASTVPVQFVDLPQQIIAAAKTAVLEAISVRDAFAAVPAKLEASIDAARRDYEALVALANLLAKPDTRAGKLVRNLIPLDSHVANAIFDDPSAHFAFFAALGPSDVNLSPAANAAVERERSRVSALTRRDFEIARDRLIEAQDRMSDLLGLGDDTYNRTKGRTALTARRTPSAHDWEILRALATAQTELEHLAASAADPRRRSPMDFYAALAAASGISFQSPRSQRAIPLVHGWSLERHAEHYLGDADRAIEIIALNELREPYIDEVGYDLPLIANGQGRFAWVADASKLWASQVVTLQSTGEPADSRTVVSVEQVDGTWRVEFDEEVEAYLLSEGAFIHGYQRGTVNSQQPIFLPDSRDPTETDLETQGLPNQEDRDLLVRIAGIDLLCDDKLGLIVTPEGDTLWATGMTFAIQMIRTYMATKKGSLLHRPTVGFDDPTGRTAAEMEPAELASSLRDLFGDDPLFTGVDAVAVQRNGPGTNIGLSVGVVGLQRRLALTFRPDR